MRPLSKMTQLILSQNEGRDFDRLSLKLGLLRADPFAFFRGTNALFLDFLPRQHSLLRAPRSLLCGDLHLENFGAYKGDNRLCYFDLNDFDEACLGPCSLDILRFVTGAKLAAPGLGLGKQQCRRLVAGFLNAYREAIEDGKPRWLERSLANGVFRTLLSRAAARSRSELLDRFTKSKGGRRRMRIDGARALPIEGAAHERLQSLLARLEAPPDYPRFFELLGAAKRIAGCGSLGLDRYMLLVRGRGSARGNFMLDLKYAAPSAVSQWLRIEQPTWTSEAERVTALQTIMQAIPPALLHAVEYRQRPFVLKELQPSIDRLDLDQWRGKTGRFKQAAAGMGHVTAWAQLRSCGRHGAAPVEDLQEYVAAERWLDSIERLAEAVAARLQGAWEDFSRDYDSGAITASLAAPGAMPARRSVEFRRPT